ncbi:MAG TPA: hypothetical protein VGO68_15970 [Pyrinomonadaceae bacterium]|nr:hypothetical protein [Pyrinomonadaceae bacterium]
MSEQNKALVQQAYDSFRAGRIDKLVDILSKDISWTLPEVNLRSPWLKEERPRCHRRALCFDKRFR